MNRIRSLGISIALASSCAFSVCASPSPSLDENRAATVQSVIEQVKVALSAAQTELAKRNLKNLPPMKQVDVDLQTVILEKSGAKFKFWIISIGATYEKDHSQEMTISLVPPSPGNPSSISTLSLTQSLVDAIVSAAEGINDAGNGTVPLATSSVVLKISFTVKKNSSGGLSTPELAPVSADVTGDLSKTAVQTLTLTFARQK